MLKIRPETPGDYETICRVVRKAFENAEHRDGDEHNLVCRLRGSEAYIPELSLVAETGGKIVGSIMFSRLKVGQTVQLALAPLAVLPGFQKRGIGAGLINEGHRLARQQGYEFSILLGSPDYYRRFGYEPAQNFGIRCPFDVPGEYFMALNLLGRKTTLNGRIEYPKAFEPQL